MSGWTLTGHNLEFPAGTTLAPGEYLLVVRNVDAITAIAPSGTQIIQRDSGNLSNNNEEVILSAGADIIDAAHYDDNGSRGDCGAWNNAADGNGASLERVVVDGQPLDGRCGDSWVPSCNAADPTYGTPGGSC